MKRLAIVAGVVLLVASCSTGEIAKRETPCPPVDILIRTPIGPIKIAKGECDTPRFKKYMEMMKDLERRRALDERLKGGI